jgi:methyl-accepting chemotaxis protein
MSMRGRLYLVAVGVVAAIVVMGLVGYFNSRAIVLEQIEKGGAVAAQSAADNVRSWIQGREAVVSTAGLNAAYLWENYGIAGMLLKPYVQRMTKEYGRLGFIDVGIGFSDGGFSDGSGWTPPDGWDPRTRPWYKAAAATSRNDPVLTAPYVDANTGQLIVTFGMPVRESTGTLLGVLNADITLADLVKLIGQQRILGVGYGVLIASDGTIIAHPRKEMVMKENVTRASAEIPPALAEAGARMVKGESGSVSFEKDGKSLTVFFRPLPHGWSLALVVPRNDLMGPIRALGLRQLLLGGAALLLLGLMILSMIRALMRPVDCLLEVSAAVAEGDLSRIACLEGSDELARLGQALDGVIGAQREILSSLRIEGENMASRARDLDELAGKTGTILSAVDERTRELSRNADENAQAVEAMTAGIQEVASSAQGAAQAASEASSYAEGLKANAEGAQEIILSTSDRVADMAQAFRKVSGAVASLNGQASQIGQIVSTISGIADQTNLLALNAAIEAARAGEAGRGFAVVAEEVRKLAEESNVAARGIGDLARAILSGTGEAVAEGESGLRLAEAVERETGVMRDRIGEVLGAIAQIVDQIQNVAATSQEQSAGAQEMAASVDRIAKGTDEARHKAEGIARSVAELAESARLLTESSGQLDRFVRSFQDLLRRYRLDGEGGSDPARPMLAARS